EKPLRKMEEVYSPELADKSKGRMINQGAPRSEGRRIAKFADKKKGNMADEGAKLVDKKGRIADEEKEYGVELEEELSVLEDIRLLHKPNYTRELFCLDKMVVHLAAGRPVSNALEEYLRPRASDPDSEYLVTPFSKFNRSQEEKKKETNPDIEKTTSDMKRLRAKLSDNLHKSLNAVPNVNMAVNRAGIANLGNTCYASCTLQSLHSIGELKSALYSYPDDVQVNEDQKSHNLTIATRNMFHELDQNTGTVQPQHFLQTLRESSPQFKEKEGDGYRQQDAAECWTLLVNTISSTLTTQASDPASAPIKNIFKIDLLERHHCTANGEDKEYKNSVYDLKCSISDRVHHLNEGLKLLLKNSVRACWYPRRKANKNEKLQYPLELDVLDFCSAELKTKIQACRQLIGAENAGCNSLSTHVESSSSDMYKDGPSLTGMYDLIAVVRHNGDTPDSGHYIAWVKQEGELWIQYDDAMATMHISHEVLNLCGGVLNLCGGGQIAYLCLYRARVVQGCLESARA
uniref:Ubiquitin carboxyl-terminal hydrolase n=2 Tax=Aegilops tauschii subsp. strangulata TaxID=200361 RepID=A0A453KTD5_AEGTS